VSLELDLAQFLADDPDRSKLRETFRQFELREPLRRLEEALGSADAAAPPPTAERELTASLQAATLEDVNRLPQKEVAIAVQAPETPEGALFSPDERWRFGLYQGGARVLGG